MEPRERVLLPLHTNAPSDEYGGLEVDVAPLFLHLLLFETVILRSIRLADVAKLVRTVGADQTIELLNAGCVHIRAGVEHIGAPNRREPVVQLVQLHPKDPVGELARMMHEAFDTLPMRSAIRHRLKLAVTKQRLTSEPAHTSFGPNAMRKTFQEAVANTDVFNRALQAASVRWANSIPIAPGAVRSEIIDGNLHFEARDIEADPGVIGQVVRRACLAVARLHTELGSMARDNAVTALDDDSTALMEAHTTFLFRSQNPDKRVEQFARVLEATGLPDFDNEVRARSIDVEQLLRIRDTNECREFRAFLTGADTLNAEELRDRTGALRGRIGGALQSTTGRILRLFATTGLGALAGGPLGAIAGAAAGMGVDAIDAFVVDKLFPRSGIVTFVGKQYPSIFDK